MKAGSGSVTDLGNDLAVWDFGDVPYGLEPLMMPPVGTAPVSAGTAPLGTKSREAELICRHLHLLAKGGADLTLASPPHEQLFWFRWITGHQVTFLVWHLMGRLITAAPENDAPDSVTLTKLETYTHAYAAMLLYTGSCPRELYESLIRPRMTLQHPAFSGTWAPDFGPIRRLLRSRGPQWMKAPEAAELRRALDLHRVVHNGIAARLVPSGQSLLQQAIEHAPVRLSAHTAAIYDSFFLTQRAPVDTAAVTHQLLHRLKAVATDLAAEGLYPMPIEEADLPDELRRDDVRECGHRLPAILHRVGESVAGPVELW